METIVTQAVKKAVDRFIETNSSKKLSKDCPILRAYINALSAREFAQYCRITERWVNTGYRDVN